MNISEHFSLEEMTFSETAARRGSECGEYGTAAKWRWRCLRAISNTTN